MEKQSYIEKLKQIALSENKKMKTDNIYCQIFNHYYFRSIIDSKDIKVLYAIYFIIKNEKNKNILRKIDNLIKNNIEFLETNSARIQDGNIVKYKLNFTKEQRSQLISLSKQIKAKNIKEKINKNLSNSTIDVK